MPPFGPKMTEELRKCRALANALDRAVDDLGLETNRGEGSVSSMVKDGEDEALELIADPKSVSKRSRRQNLRRPMAQQQGGMWESDADKYAHPRIRVCTSRTHARPHRHWGWRSLRSTSGR